MESQVRPRKPYPTDVSDEEWAFVAPYLALVREDAPQRHHDLREVFMAYYMGRYVNQVVKEGKAQLNLPMYVNAWLGPQPKAELPGQWPSG